MHRINRISIKGFRRLRDVNLKMRPFIVMVGPNGVGKTSVLDALNLLSASASGKLKDTLNQFGGMSSILTKSESGRLTFEAEMSCENDVPLEYLLSLETLHVSYSICQENLLQYYNGKEKAPFKHFEVIKDKIKFFDNTKKRLSTATWSHDPSESVLSQVHKMFSKPEEFKRILSSLTQYHVLDVGPRAPVRLPQNMRPATLPGSNGEDLVSFLYYLRETDKERFEIIDDSLKAAFPGYEWMQFPPVAAGMLTLAWKEKFFHHPQYIHQLSEGTLRFLWLISLLLSPGLSTITMIDEPEVSLHPELLKLLVNTMREASARTQLIVATHSDRLVRFLDPSEVVVLEIGEDGYTELRWGDEMDLNDWLEEYSLDEALHMELGRWR